MNPKVAEIIEQFKELSKDEQGVLLNALEQLDTHNKTNYIKERKQKL